MRHTAGWQDTPLGRIEPLPADRQPVRDRADRERTTRDSAEQIRLAVECLRRNLPDEERLFIESGYFDVPRQDICPPKEETIKARSHFKCMRGQDDREVQFGQE
jgi:hypothetical protein